MSEELEALSVIKEELRIVDCDDNGICYNVGYNHKEEIDIIETALKALEIIKEKVMSLVNFIATNNNEFMVCDSDFCKHNNLTQEEYGLLKEVML